jgi:hypothetical protein
MFINAHIPIASEFCNAMRTHWLLPSVLAPFLAFVERWVCREAPDIAIGCVSPDHERLFSFRRSLHESFGHGYYSSGNPASGLPARAFDFSFYSKERKG